MSSKPTAPIPTRAYVAFEGGGAKGLVHVGALRAIEEEHRFEFRGFAGTSAGAIMAALAAAGFSAREIVDSDNQTTLLDSLNDKIPDATALLGDGRWPLVRWFRTFWRWAASWTFCWTVAAMSLLAVLCASYVRWWLAGVLWTGVIAIGWMTVKVLSKGLGRLDKLRDLLQTVLQNRLFPDEPNRIVRFSDFGVNGRPTLKIVATEISRGRLHLFCPEDTPDESVADAVVASLCIPILFPPFSIGPLMFLDGGLVSNLPAWSFDEERIFDPDALTIGVEIESGGGEYNEQSKPWWLKALRTAIFGAAVLDKRAVHRFIPISLTTNVGLLAFDISRADTFRVVEEARQATRAKLLKYFRYPELFSMGCELVRNAATVAITKNPQVLRNPPLTTPIRVALAMPRERYKKSLWLEHCCGYDDFRDSGVVLPITGSFVGQAWTSRVPTLNTSGPTPPGFLQGPEYDRLRAILRQDMAWALCIPILDTNGNPMAIVAIDSGDRLDEGWPGQQELFGLLFEEVGTIFRQTLLDLQED